ncbi:hypothetical protein JW805_04950 [Roseomonas aeriglobus]|nr:hypothetical protein [Roseomonas aeriglobus]
MIDETNVGIDPRDQADDVRYGETLLYDYAKFVTTLSLIVLGAVLTLSSTTGGKTLRTDMLILVVAAVSAGGTTALSVANAIIDARVAGRAPSRHLRKAMKLGMGLLGLGVGGFIVIWMELLQ